MNRKPNTLLAAMLIATASVTALSAPATLPEADQGITNAMHGERVGQIVFTRSDLTLSAINNGNLASDFTLGQPMFFRVYMDKSAVNQFVGKPGFTTRQNIADNIVYIARFTIGDTMIETEFDRWGLSTEQNLWTTWRGQFVNPDNSPGSERPGSEVLRELLSRATAKGMLTSGTHQIKMEIQPFVRGGKPGPERLGDTGRRLVGPVVASGSFNLSIPAGAFARSNRSVCGKQPTSSNPSTEQYALSYAKRTWPDAGAAPVRVYSSGDTWNVERNELTGIPIERWMLVTFPAKSAGYCYNRTYAFIEPFAGSGFSSASGKLSPNSEFDYIPCPCVG